MSTQPVTILPIQATTSEVKEMMGVFKAAFGPDPLLELCFNRPNVQHKSDDEHVNGHLERLANPRFIYHKAVDAQRPDGPILGVAAWFLVEDPHTSPQNDPWGDPSAGVHLECYDASLGVLRRWRRDHFRELNQPFIYMAILTVLPEFQRRGVGSALLRHGLQEADRRGWPSFIEASPYGLGLYLKFGWEETLRTTVNLKDYGGDDIECDTVAMVRPAGAKEKVA